VIVEHQYIMIEETFKFIPREQIMIKTTREYSEDQVINNLYYLIEEVKYNVSAYYICYIPTRYYVPIMVHMYLLTCATSIIVKCSYTNILNFEHFKVKLCFKHIEYG